MIRPEPPQIKPANRLDLASLTTTATRQHTATDPVVDAERAVRDKLSQEAGELLAQRVTNKDDIIAFVENALADMSLTESERATALSALTQDLFGWGRLDAFMTDPTVSEIIVDGPQAVDIERNGLLERVPVRWLNDAELMEYIKTLIRDTGRPLDKEHPIVDVEVKGARINATAPPVSPLCTLNIRKSADQTVRFTPAEYVKTGAADWKTLRLYLALVRGAATTLVCGRMGTGKTALVRLGIENGAPDATRWIFLEDVRETEANVQRFVSLQTVQRRENPITMPDLFATTKRKRPDRVGVGEVRSDKEAMPMVQSVMMGVPGALTTTHAGTPKQALFNFVFYLKQAGLDVREDFLVQVLHESLDVLVFIDRFRNGHRRITRIVEVLPLGDPANPSGFQDLIRWDHHQQDWVWEHPLSEALTERLMVEGVVVPRPDEGPIGPEHVHPDALDRIEALS